MKVIGLGAGGHCSVMIDALLAGGWHEIIGLVDPESEKWGSRILGVPVRGDDTIVPALMAEGARGFFVGLIGARDTRLRQTVFRQGVRFGLAPVSVKHPAAITGRNVESGAGFTQFAGSIVNPNVVVGEDVTLNSACVVEHDVRLGDHVHVAPRAVVLGGVQIDSGAFIGAGAVIRQGMRIGANAVIAAGAVVVSDVRAGAVVAGVPGKEVNV